MLSKTCTRILRPYGFEDVHTPLPAQYALNRLIRLDRHSGIHTRESRAGPHGGSLELSIERPTLIAVRFYEKTSMANGTVKWFNSDKGYGFIRPDGGHQDDFVHISAVERSGVSAHRK